MDNTLPNPDDFYTQGYNDGYGHLAQGRWNFLHPYGSFTYESGRTIKGYIPGGPRVFVNDHAPYRSKEYNEARKLETECNRAWLRGWIDGINKYVLDNGLPYAQIPQSATG